MARHGLGRATTRLLLIAALAVAAPACGRKAPPLPPIILVAEQTRDLTVYQQGSEAVLSWSFPSMTTAGSPLTDLEAVEVWRAQLPLAQEPRGTSSRDRAMQVQLIESRGERLLVLDPDALELATRGAELEIHDDLGRWHAEHADELPLVIWYAVRTRCCRGRPSQLSNIARLVPQSAPEPPEGLELEASQAGILLSWQAVEELAVVVERSADEASWEPVAHALATGEWLDTSASQNQVWFYRLRSVRIGEDAAQVVGEPGPVAHIEYLDRFPPATPSNLVCLPEGRRTRLRWDRSDDAAAYRVHRQLADGERETLAQRWSDVEFGDETPPPGTLVYLVIAVDLVGNESEPATCTAVIGPAP